MALSGLFPSLTQEESQLVWAVSNTESIESK